MIKVFSNRKILSKNAPEIVDTDTYSFTLVYYTITTAAQLLLRLIYC